MLELVHICLNRDCSNVLIVVFANLPIVYATTFHYPHNSEVPTWINQARLTIYVYICICIYIYICICIQVSRIAFKIQIRVGYEE